MRRSLEFIFGLLDAHYPAYVAREDLDGPHAAALRLFRSQGLIDDEPSMNPVPSCPHCLAGTPYPLGRAYLCNRCRSEVDVTDLQIWRLGIDAFLRWLARGLQLRGGVERIDDGLWRLGTAEGGWAIECFYIRGSSPTELARRRLTAYRHAVVLHGKAARPAIAGFDGPILALAELLSVEDNSLSLRPLGSLLRRGGAVRFDRATGALSAGDVLLGRIPQGTREFHLLSYLADYPGTAVPYADLKHYVCAKSGSADEADEATFCQKLKSRIKHEHGVEQIDAVVRSDRYAGGYVLLTEADLPPE